MSEESLKLIKNHLGESLGGLGTRIYENALSKLNTGKDPSRKDIETLILYLEKTIAKLYGINRSKVIFDNIHRELIAFDRFYEKFFGSKIKDTMDNFFEMKGIPGEKEIKQIAKFMISNGYEQNEKDLIKTLKRFSKEKIAGAMKGSIMHNEIMSFLDRNPAYTQADIEDFINGLRDNKLDMNDVDIKDKIEKERLFRKFNYMERKENEDDKISRQYIALKNSFMRKDYDYVISDEDLTLFMKKFRIEHL